ncbi:MAG: UPF0280 family protein [Sedimentisphaerales bacterium]|nr:UPF0280 family protein [Sedimentisphaerales bacterium]
MSRKRTYRNFTHREAVFRICCNKFDTVTEEIIRQRSILEDYIKSHPDFLHSFEPVELLDNAPQVAQRMAEAAWLVGVGPMAAVAGAMAQLAAEAGLKAGATEAIIENGGDIYLKAAEPVLIALNTGTTELSDRLAFSLKPEDTPVSICSSSGKMGHSRSLGKCDLATVVAKDAALADAAATQAANLVGKVEDIDSALQRITAIEGIEGVLIVKNDRIGLAGKLPTLVKVK